MAVRGGRTGGSPHRNIAGRTTPRLDSPNPHLFYPGWLGREDCAPLTLCPNYGVGSSRRGVPAWWTAEQSGGGWKILNCIEGEPLPVVDGVYYVLLPLARRPLYTVILFILRGGQLFCQLSAVVAADGGTGGGARRAAAYLQPQRRGKDATLSATAAAEQRRRQFHCPWQRHYCVFRYSYEFAMPVITMREKGSRRWRGNDCRLRAIPDGQASRPNNGRDPSRHGEWRRRRAGCSGITQQRLNHRQQRTARGSVLWLYCRH